MKETVRGEDKEEVSLLVFGLAAMRTDWIF